MNRWLVAGLALLTGLALGLRAPRLALRPLHNDEAVNAMRFQLLWVNNSYKYDPNEFHGPTLPYFTLPAAWLNGSADFNQFTESTFRAVTVAFGAGLLLLLLLAPELGKAEILWAAALTAVSPAMVFYSRYYIHEMLLVFFTALTFFSAWRYAQNARLLWALASGIGLGLMAATKETFVFAVAAAAFSNVATRLWGKWRDRGLPPFQPLWRGAHVIGGLLVAAGVGLLFFSSFFRNAAGPWAAIQTYLPWLRRAGGATEHAHEWSFYFRRLLFFHSKGGPVWSEAFIMTLALVGFFAALFGPAVSPAARLLRRLIAFYTLCLTCIYTLLAYKTPWCLLGFYHGMILLGGVGAMALWRACAKQGAFRALAAVTLAAGVGHLAWQAWAENFAVSKNGVPFCDSERNPYVYSQTVPDALRLVHTVEALAQVSPQRYDTVVEIMGSESYWPLPWYLRRFKKIGYWDKIPDQPLAPIMIVSTSLHAAFDERPEKTHLMAGYFELRPGVFFELYVNINLWSSYIKTLPPEEN